MTGIPELDADLGRDRQYLVYAEAYTEAARLLAESAATMEAVRIPFFHLVGHAMELMLKAAISRQGYDEEWLMRMRHGLERSYAKAISAGADDLEDEDLAAFVEELYQPHAMQAFRYPQWFQSPIPEPARAVRLLNRQLDVVRSYLATDR